MGENVFFDRDIPFKNASCNYKMLQELNSVEEVQFQESIPHDFSWYNVPANVFDEFLLKRFGHTIEDFRKLYLKEHSKTLGFDENQCLEITSIIHPIPPSIRVYMGEIHSIFELVFKYEEFKDLTIAHSCSGPLHLHNDIISNFTIIRAKFSNLLVTPESLELLKNNSFFGYYLSTEKFNFFISSSAQLDLTIVYEEI